MTDEEGHGSGVSFLRTFVPIIAMFFLIVLVFGGMFGYMDHLEHEGTEEVCDERFGEESEYIGDSGFASETGVCDTPEGQKHVEKDSAPPSIGTLLEYVGV